MTPSAAMNLSKQPLTDKSKVHVDVDKNRQRRNNLTTQGDDRAIY